ncbi:hypothetical protein [Metabacillus fastidiosus]|uniref:hypothetical protein n=1 Tax=Metabacillus fastidiosus TaxID=1458 RepID=UPI003D2C5021
MTSNSNVYKPVVPKWVAEILELDKLRRQNQYRGSLCSGETRMKWDEWKYRYSRKLKYARLNGWIVEKDKD